ncbi:protein ligase RNF216 [Seminavis robusta]|uniref:Protein ligase RNF216 n=1 Tax=Seminavis robusta TaxID=568900 RepID=A0A9N8DXP0_9STRA|nr:protein ligase RNF216 [Seminavis robusta]|eukprot:Sro426_g140530.1 protein ligase RNF216 (632) ;mRNA; r:59178-61145
MDPPAKSYAAGIVDLCDVDSDNDEVVVAAAKPPARRKRDTDSDDDIVEVLETRKRPRGNLKKSDDDDDVVEVVHTKAMPKTPLQQVLEVFPDVKHDHANQLLKEHSNVAANVINALLESGPSYPKEDRKPAASGNMQANNKCEPKYNFLSASSFEPTRDYIEESAEKLVLEFPGILTKKGAKFFLQQSNNHYAIAFEKLVRSLTGRGDRSTAKASLNGTEDSEIKQYEKLTAAKKSSTIDKEQKDRMKREFNATPKKDHFRARPANFKNSNARIKNSILTEEAAFCKRKLDLWREEIDTKVQKKVNRETAIREGTAVECGCCYDKVAMDEMVQCRIEGHLFCGECLAQYVENQVFANQSFGKDPKTREPALELLCFHGDGCSSGFDRFFLQRSLKPKVLEKYDELQSRINVEKAGLVAMMCSCPKCGYSAAVDKAQNIFLCPNVECRFESCRHCREESHIPLRCDEVEKKQEEDARTRVEEAASNAVIRFCPACKKGMVKESGCNKMTCACGIHFCYICREKVQDYKHFCQIPHCQHRKGKDKKCSGCPLWTKDLDATHNKEMREAALSEAARLEAEASASGLQQQEKKAGLFGQTEDKAKSLQPAKVKVDVESILQAPKARAAAVARRVG